MDQVVLSCLGEELREKAACIDTLLTLYDMEEGRVKMGDTLRRELTPKTRQNQNDGHWSFIIILVQLFVFILI